MTDVATNERLATGGSYNDADLQVIKSKFR